MPELTRSLRPPPACYDHAVDSVALVETHIPCVLPSREFAHKIKKPLNLGFLDFSAVSRSAITWQPCAFESFLAKTRLVRSRVVRPFSDHD